MVSQIAKSSEHDGKDQPRSSHESNMQIGRPNSFTVAPAESSESKDDQSVEIDVGDWLVDPQRIQSRQDSRSFCAKHCTGFILLGCIVVGSVVGISIFLTGSANPGEFFVQEDPPGMTDVNPWRVRPKTGLRMAVLNALEDQWTPAFDQYVQEWDNGEPDSLILSSRKVAHDVDCSPVDGLIKVCNGDYGNTNWRGINVMLTQNGFAVNSAAKLNDYHLDRGSESQRLYTMCHEIGHALGLPHTDENYHNRNRGDCLDYTTRPEGNLRPGQFNFDLLADVYGIVGSTPDAPSGSSGAPGSRPPRNEDEDDRGRHVRRLGDPSKYLPCDNADELLTNLDPTPSFILNSYRTVVSKLEHMSCEDLHADQSGPNVRMLHQHTRGEGCEVELGYDGSSTYSVHIHKLRV